MARWASTVLLAAPREPGSGSSLVLAAGLFLLGLVLILYGIWTIFGFVIAWDLSIGSILGHILLGTLTIVVGAVLINFALLLAGVTIVMELFSKRSGYHPSYAQGPEPNYGPPRLTPASPPPPRSGG